MIFNWLIRGIETACLPSWGGGKFISKGKLVTYMGRYAI